MRCNWCEWQGVEEDLKLSGYGEDAIELCPECGQNSEGKIMDITN